MSKTRTSKSTAKKQSKPSRTSAASASSSKAETKTTEIRDLIDFIARSGLNEVNIETQELKLHVKREPDTKIFGGSAAPPPPPVAAAPAPVPTVREQLQQQTPAQKPAPEAAGKHTVEIKSPMIGTFYRSSSPDTPPFVSVGDKVSKGQTVCIIEAMKLFNEIESEVSGTVVKVALENATPVEYDQVLFVVEPD